ncbi:MAG: hypothetical protein R3B60_04230 [Candidatus Paceibacterota bacterium]
MSVTQPMFVISTKNLFNKFFKILTKLIEIKPEVNLNELSEAQIITHLASNHRRARIIVSELIKKNNSINTDYTDCFSSGVKYANVLNTLGIRSKDIVLLYYIYKKDILSLRQALVANHLENEQCCHHDKMNVKVPLSMALEKLKKRQRK